MKVNFNNDNITDRISNVPIGSTFLDTRRSKNEMGVYMRIDTNNWTIYQKSETVLAINLESGQLKKYKRNDIVTPVKAEVILP